jgi:hypothetical protein
VRRPAAAIQRSPSCHRDLGDAQRFVYAIGWWYAHAVEYGGPDLHVCVSFQGRATQSASFFGKKKQELLIIGCAGHYKHLAK